VRIHQRTSSSFEHHEEKLKTPKRMMTARDELFAGEEHDDDDADREDGADLEQREAVCRRVETSGRL
jgi:GTP cyclohydrolase I